MSLPPGKDVGSGSFRNFSRPHTIIRPPGRSRHSLARRTFASNLDVDLDPEMFAKDLWSAFDPAHPLQARTAKRYRDKILRPGKSRPAAESVRQFLGRPFALASWQHWLEGGSRD